MKNFYKKLIISSLIVFSSCYCVPRAFNSKHEDEDKFWKDFSNAIETGNQTYLVNNSADSIICMDCVSDTNKDERHFYKASFIFANYLEKLNLVGNIRSHEYTEYRDSLNNNVIVSLFVERKKGGVSYSISYTFINQSNKMIFTGMSFVD